MIKDYNYLLVKELKMSVRTITVKEIISRVRQVFPDAPEKYIMSLVNDALVELGMYNSKVSTAKLSTTANQMYYSLKDAAKDSSNNILEVNKVFKVYFMDDNGDYMQIPRLVDTNVILTDATSESNLNTPDSN